MEVAFLEGLIKGSGQLPTNMERVGACLLKRVEPNDQSKGRFQPVAAALGCRVRYGFDPFPVVQATLTL